MEKLYPLPVIEINGFLYIEKEDCPDYYYIYVEDRYQEPDVIDLIPNNKKVWELKGE